MDLLATIPARSAEERELKRRAQEHVDARDAARREDAARAPAVENMRRTYETVRTLAELRRDALAAALPALGAEPDLRREIEAVVDEWPEEAPARSATADAQIEALKAARENTWSYVSRCGALATRVVAALGAEHPASRELVEVNNLL